MLVRLPSVPAHPADLRAARLAGPADLRRSPRHSAGRRRRVRLLLDYNAADLTLEGAFLAGLSPGPYAGAIVGVMVGLPPLSPANSSRCRSRSAAALRAAACASSVRRKRSGTSRRSSSPACHRRVWQMLRALKIDWQVVCCSAPIGARADPPGARRALERPRACSTSRHRAVGWTAGRRPARDGALRRHADQDLEQRAHRAPAGGAGKAAAGGAGSRRWPTRSTRTSCSTR